MLSSCRGDPLRVPHNMCPGPLRQLQQGEHKGPKNLKSAEKAMTTICFFFPCRVSYLVLVGWLVVFSPSFPFPSFEKFLLTMK